ncbi:MAG: PD-(D/E)XK nuclease family transposase, partial [Acetatifactor sp.]|nr:PD-(D/E)XK nuclease family transposase [Acetatifactor sp.]
MRKLEELNLVDDFLVNSLTSHQVYGEPAARCILECILGRKIGKLNVIPQHFMQGEDTDKHGIRMDVYLDEEDGELFDLESDKNSKEVDVEDLPKRARFYHAKLDAGSLESGARYGALRNVFVIFIMTYDPFGADRMVYTVKNGCVEMPELPYEDGARTIFLYTKGTEGNP